jgi:hypothetical protein
MMVFGLPVQCLRHAELSEPSFSPIGQIEMKVRIGSCAQNMWWNSIGIKPL